MVTRQDPSRSGERSGAERARETKKVTTLELQHEYLDEQDSTAQQLPTRKIPSAMVVKIRLARFGRSKAPFYNIVVAQARYV